MIALRQITKDFREAGSLSALVPLCGFVGDHVFLTKSGDVGVVFHVKGIDGECLDHSQLDQAARRFEGAVRTFDERFRLYQYLLKRNHAGIPHGEYSNPVVKQAIANRIALFEAKQADLYQLDIYHVLMYEGWRHRSTWADRLRQFSGSPSNALAGVFSTHHRSTLLDADLARACELLRNKAESFLVQLRDVFGLRWLEREEALAFFRRLLNFAPYKQAVSQAFDAQLDFIACNSMLECHRDHLRLDDYFVQVLTLKEPPAQTFANILRALQELPANYVIATEWKRESNLAIRKAIHSKRRHFHNSKASLTNYLGDKPANAHEMLIDDAAAGLVSDLGQCLRELEIQGNYFGRFSLTVVLYDEERARVRRATAECFKIFGTHDAVLTEERYNLLNAFLAILPGNHAFNLRHAWLLNTNHADLSLLHVPFCGDMRNRHLDKEYLAVLETNSATPFFLNLHYQDIAHTMVLGATGSGKSFFLNFLLTNLQKYEPLTYIFDLGGSYRSLTRLFAGSYLRVGIEQRSFTINPFSLSPTKENLHFLFSFVKVLLESGGYRLTNQDQRDLYEQIENIYAVEAEQRRLFTLANILSRNLSQHLHKWIQGGQYGALFDNAEDNLTLARFQAFDFEGMDKYPQLLEPLLFYILHRASAAIYDPDRATVLKAFVMDEAWRFLRNESIRAYITEAVKTWRKHNAAMILATQSADDLERSEMLGVVVESCPTKMFLANPGMDRKSYREIFHLNETETELVARLVPKRQILIKRPDVSKVVNLNVDPAGYWLYTSNPYEDQRRREAFERLGFERGLEELTRSNS